MRIKRGRGNRGVGMLHNELFWAGVIRRDFVEEIRTFGQALKDRILKAFDNVEQEAEKLKKEEHERLLQAPADEDGGPGMDVLAERTEEKGISFYLTMRSLQQGLVNLFAVALYELFIQHLMILYRKEILEIHEENNKKLFKMCKVKRRFREGGIDIEKFRSWEKIEELRLVANTVKHAEGESADKLRKIRRDLFDPLRGTSFESSDQSAPPKGALFEPLFGQGLFVKPDNIDSYTSTIIEFWEELAVALEKHTRVI